MCLAGSSPRFRLDRLSCLHQDGAECPRASPLFLPIVSIFARGAPAHFAIVLAIHSAAASHRLLLRVVGALNGTHSLAHSRRWRSRPQHH